MSPITYVLLIFVAILLAGWAAWVMQNRHDNQRRSRARDLAPAHLHVQRQFTAEAKRFRKGELRRLLHTFHYWLEEEEHNLALKLRTEWQHLMHHRRLAAQQEQAKR